MVTPAERKPRDDAAPGPPPLGLEQLRLEDFRNYARLALETGPEPVVLTGPNGAGKTNLLEAISLLVPGRGLRRAQFAELTRHGAARGWAVAARADGVQGPVRIGTGIGDAEAATGRQVRIDGEPVRGSAALGEHLRAVWLTPAMDGLFTGPASDRRRFLDRLIQSLDPALSAVAGRYDRAMRQRNRLLENGGGAAEFEGLEAQMAEAGVAIASARLQALAQLAAHTQAARDHGGPFPWATLALDGTLEGELGRMAAVDVEDAARAALADGRERDRAAKRTLHGPHRTDLLVGHGPKGMAARSCSTGEQKALLIGLVLAHAELVAERGGGRAPLVLLDEIAAHLDAERRAGLFAEVARLGAQAWMTGTGAHLFADLAGKARFLAVENGGVRG